MHKKHTHGIITLAISSGMFLMATQAMAFFPCNEVYLRLDVKNNHHSHTYT